MPREHPHRGGAKQVVSRQQGRHSRHSADRIESLEEHGPGGGRGLRLTKQGAESSDPEGMGGDSRKVRIKVKKMASQM